MKRYVSFINDNIDWDINLINACSMGHLEGVKLALNNGANVHHNNDDALYWADLTAHPNIRDFLLEYIIESEPTYIPKMMKYISGEIREKYPWYFDAMDHNLMGLKVNERIKIDPNVFKNTKFKVGDKVYSIYDKSNVCEIINIFYYVGGNKYFYMLNDIKGPYKQGELINNPGMIHNYISYKLISNEDKDKRFNWSAENGKDLTLVEPALPEDQFEEWDDINEIWTDGINIGNVVEIERTCGGEFLVGCTGIVIDTIENCGGIDWYIVEFDDAHDIKDELIKYIDDNNYLWHDCLREYFINRKMDGKKYNIFMFTMDELKVISTVVKPEDQFEEWEDINEDNEYKFQLKIGDKVKIIDMGVRSIYANDTNLIGKTGTIIGFKESDFSRPVIEFNFDFGGIFAYPNGKKGFCMLIQSDMTIEIINEPEDQFEDWEDINEDNNHKFEIGDKVKIPKTKSNLPYKGNPEQCSAVSEARIRKQDFLYITKIVGIDEYGVGVNKNSFASIFKTNDLEFYEDEPEDQFEDWEDINEGNYDNSRFKKGDRVRLINTKNVHARHINKTGTVISDTLLGLDIKFDDKLNIIHYHKKLSDYEFDYEFDYDKPEDQFEEWEDINEGNDYEFQIEDKVIYHPYEKMIVSDNIYQYLDGKQATIIKTRSLDDDNTYFYTLKFNIDYGIVTKFFTLKNYIDPNKNWPAYEGEIELIEHENTDQFEEWEDINENNDYKFQVGDKVRKKYGKVFSNGDKIVTISKIDKIGIWFKETGTYYADKGEIELIEPEETDQFEDWEDINEDTKYEFQIGDKVILNKNSPYNYGKEREQLYGIGEIIKIYDSSFRNPYRVVWEYDGNKYTNSYRYSDLELTYPEPEDQFEDWEDINESTQDCNGNEIHVGDRVEHIGSSNMRAGEQGIVIGLENRHIFVELDNPVGNPMSYATTKYNAKEGHGWFTYAKYFKLVNNIETDQFEDWEDI